ncbi:unnamed protein product [Adineta ricciae]|uniref:Apple domain-containing protein n=1 Tax=Adineta ricciae TaxID=249248 RepID=A0A815TQT4_ADIRI|nr:unnamed protein product [Adineta ricciae]CAF1509361.1 unnamed protein product [Adineta ricciae]
MNSSILAFALLAFMLDNKTVLIIIELTIVFSIPNVPTQSRCTNIISGYDASGGDIDGINPGYVLSADACAALCESISVCNHWTFHTDSGQCCLKNKSSEIRAHSGMYSGNCTKSK